YDIPPLGGKIFSNPPSSLASRFGRRPRSDNRNARTTNSVEVAAHIENHRAVRQPSKRLWIGVGQWRNDCCIKFRSSRNSEVGLAFRLCQGPSDLNCLRRARMMPAQRLEVRRMKFGAGSKMLLCLRANARKEAQDN